MLFMMTMITKQKKQYWLSQKVCDIFFYTLH